MILYHAVTYFQVLWITIFHLAYKREKKAVLVLVESLKTRLSKPIQEKLNEIFEVYYFPYNKIGKIPNNLSVEEKSNYIQKRMIELYQTHIGYELEQYEEIYIAGYHFYFSLILLKYSIAFNVIEEAVGMLSRPELLYSIVQNLNVTQLEVALYNKLIYSENKLIQKKYCSVTHQKDGFVDERLEDIDIMKTLQKLDKTTLKKIISIFVNQYQEYQITEDSILLLTQHFANLKILSFEEQALIYQYYVDYFVNDMKLIIKPHPDDVMYYSELFPNACIIKEKFPSELLPYIFNVYPKTIGTISSTAIFSIKSVFKEAIEFTPAFEKEFKNIHRYYMGLYILTNLNVSGDIQILGCNEELVKNILRYSDLKNKKSSYKILEYVKEIDWMKPILIDKYDETYFQDNTEVMKNNAQNIIFINSQENFSFYRNFDKDIRNMILPIVIKKKKFLENHVFADENEEVIFYYSYDKGNKKMVNKMHIEKKLKNSGIDIVKNELSDEKLRIKLLESILKVTEERLKYYIEQKSELLDRVRDLEEGIVLQMHLEKEESLQKEIEKLQEENLKLKEQEKEAINEDEELR